MYLLATTTTAFQELHELIKIQILRWTRVRPQSRHLVRKIQTWAGCHPLTRYATRVLTTRMQSGRVPYPEGQSSSRVSRLSLEAIIWIWAFRKPQVEVYRSRTKTTLSSRYKSVELLMKLVKAKWAKVTKGQEWAMLIITILAVKRCYLLNLPNKSINRMALLICPKR